MHDLWTKPDLSQSMERVYAWYHGEILDRVPVRFSGHNEEFNIIDKNSNWKNQQDRWFDVEYRVDKFLEGITDKTFLGETFPVFWPNLGPNIFAAMLGGTLEFGEVTSWIHPFIHVESDLPKIQLDRAGIYYEKLNQLIDYALTVCSNKFLVGYTDMHPGLDCVDAMHGTTAVCLDIYDNPDFVKQMVEKTFDPFVELMTEFDRKLKEHDQLSVSWLNIPSYEIMHIPSCDLGSMLSKEAFVEFALPSIQKEISCFTHNIFHIDGRGVGNHIDVLLEQPEIQGYQWVQGVGNDRPIMQWLPFIKKIQNHKKGVIIDLQTNELEEFLTEMKPRGIYLCIDEPDTEIQKRILARLETWK